MNISAKGFFIWRISAILNGDVSQIAATAQNAGLSHLLIKVADGKYDYNISKGVDMLPPLITQLRKRGIQVWGWHYVYGASPKEEADRAVLRMKQLNLDGYVINAEGPFKASGMASAAQTLMSRLRSNANGVPIGLSTYRYPSVHPEFPIAAFEPYVDIWMPQVYWQAATNPAWQLNKSYNEYKKLGASRPYVPTGAAYRAGSWAPTGSQVTEFLKEARKLNLPAANFWEWGAATSIGADLWDAVKAFTWAGSTPGPAPKPDPAPTPIPEPTPGYSQSDKISRLDELAITASYLNNRYASLTGSGRRDEIERLRQYLSQRQQQLA